MSEGWYEVLSAAVETLDVDILLKACQNKQELSPLCLHGCGVVSGAGDAVPGAVRIPGQAAVGTGRAVHVTLVELHLSYDWLRPHVELLLQKVHQTGLLQCPLKRLFPTQLLKLFIWTIFRVDWSLLAGCASSLWPEGGRATLQENIWLQSKLSYWGQRNRKKVKWTSLFWHFLASEVSAFRIYVSFSSSRYFPMLPSLHLSVT